MPDPTLALREGQWALEEAAHQFSYYWEDQEDTGWIPFEDVLGMVDVLRWLIARELEDAERPPPSALRPA